MLCEVLKILIQNKQRAGLAQSKQKSIMCFDEEQRVQDVYPFDAGPEQ